MTCPARARSSWLRWRARRDGSLTVETLLAREAASFDEHWHDEWSLGVILAGACAFTWAGRSELASAGDLVLIAPRVLHAARTRAAGFRMVMLYLPVAAVDGWIGGGAPATLRRARWRSAEDAAALLDAWKRRELRDVEPVFRRTLSACGGAPSAGPRGLDARVARGLQLLVRDDASSRRLRVGEVARRLGVSREYLHRLFRRQAGVTPLQVERLARLERACGLLRRGRPVAEVAQACGFADQGHLGRWFRACYGVTPSAFGRAAGDALVEDVTAATAPPPRS